MATEHDRKSDFDAAYQQAASHWSGWQAVARSDLRVYAGDPWNGEDRRIAKARNRELLSFPQLRRVVKWLAGYERDHRLSITYDPMEGGDLETASQLNMVALWALQLCNGYNVVSDAFEGALKTGINLVNVYNDRNINTRFERFMYHQFLLDPTFTRVDLQDCHYGILRKYVDAAAAKMLLPGKESFIDSLTGGQDEKFTNYPRPAMYGEKLLAYDEFQKKVTRKRYVLTIVPTQDELVFDTKKQVEMTLRRMLEAGINPNILTVRQRWDPTVEVDVFLNGNEVSHAIDPFGLDDFSFAPIVAYFDPDCERSEQALQSVIRQLIDAQKAADKKMMSMIAWIEQQAGAGLDYEQGALVDDNDAYVTGSGKPRLFNKGALENNRARDRVVPDIPQGVFQLWNELGEDILKRAGYNPDMMGYPQGQGNVRVSGGLAKLRMGAGLVGFRDLFDNRSVSVKRLGVTLQKLIQQYPGFKIQRITNKPASDQFYNRQFGKYDVAVAEGMLSDTQRALAYAEMFAMKELGHNMQDPVPITWKRLIEVSPIQQPVELLREVEQQEQAQLAARQRQEKLNEALQQLAIAQAQSEIAQNQQLAEQQRTAALENQTEAAFDRVKTAAEINDLQNKGGLELLRMAVDLEKAKIGAKKSA